MENAGITEEQHRLSADCQAFVGAANGFSEEKFSQQIAGKWSVADVMQHLYLSARPVARLMIGPRDVFRQWGQSDTPPRTYNALATAYQNRLALGGEAPASMLPRPEDMQVEQCIIIDRFTGVYQALINEIPNWSDQELDEYVIPHPALGKLTVREMLYFTSIHTRHHLRLLPKP